MSNISITSGQKQKTLSIVRNCFENKIFVIGKTFLIPIVIIFFKNNPTFFSGKKLERTGSNGIFIENLFLAFIWFDYTYGKKAQKFEKRSIIII